MPWPRSPGRPRRPRRAHRDGRPQAARADVGKTFQRLVQLMHLCGRRVFLRTEYVRRALRTAEWIVHVAGHVDARAGQPGVESLDIDGGDPRQRAAARRQAVPLGVQQPRAQRGQHAGAGVVGGGAAQAQDDVTRAGVECSQDQLAHAVAAGAHRVSARRRDQLQAGSGGHFDDGRAVRQHAPDRVDLVAQRIVHGLHARFARGRGEHRLDRALAAIGHGHADSLRAGNSGFHAAGDGLGRGWRGNAFLERVGCDDDFHDADKPGQDRWRS